MKRAITFIFLICIMPFLIFAQTNKESIPLVKNNSVIPLNVGMAEETYLGKESLKVFDQGANTDVTYVRINNLMMKNGTIEIEMAGKPASGSFEQARGFVGIAFRINEDNSKYECFYLRPTNGRAEDQVRRNHSVQYISYPDFPWYKLRKDFPEKYESYVDLVPGEWTKIRIEIAGDTAKLYVHGNSQPTLIVNDLKLGADVPGKIGLWVGPGTEAHFADLEVTREE